ncbi:MAG: hypothetical protein HFI69_05760 [Lachnospiraceae bacterium]|nr:hypothetical protein [Lachnospiraceae bacterium]
MKDLIKDIAIDQSTDIMIKAALIYYQFEAIHTSNIGNGRVKSCCWLYCL